MPLPGYAADSTHEVVLVVFVFSPVREQTKRLASYGCNLIRFLVGVALHRSS